MSALKEFANATIFLSVVKGYVSDGLNEVPQVEAIAVRALLKTKKLSQITIGAGVDVQTEILEGHIIEQLPEGVTLPQQVTVQLDTGFTQSGTLKAIVPSPFYDEVSLLGLPVVVR
jgi:hypothetical protein